MRSKIESLHFGENHGLLLFRADAEMVLKIKTRYHPPNSNRPLQKDFLAAKECEKFKRMEQ